jgi:DNA-binding response OmpR family regulator
MTTIAVSAQWDKETTDRAHRQRLLLVESDHEIRGLMRRFFEMRGFDCQGAADAEAAERMCEEMPPFDLVIAAACLPVTSGFELLARLRSEHKALPLVLLRGFDGVDSRQNQTEAARFGAHFVAKPVRLSTLLETALAALEEAHRSALAARAGAVTFATTLVPRGEAASADGLRRSNVAAANAVSPA